jgi:hypothetical protein
VGITESAASTFGRTPAEPVFSQILQKFTCGAVKYLRADRHSNCQVFTFATCPV